MTNEEIKVEVESLCSIRDQANDRIKEIQESICQHDSTEEGLFSWRPGCIDKALFCSHCGKLIKNLGIPDWP